MRKLLFLALLGALATALAAAVPATPGTPGPRFVRLDATPNTSGHVLDPRRRWLGFTSSGKILQQIPNSKFVFLNGSSYTVDVVGNRDPGQLKALLTCKDGNPVLIRVAKFDGTRKTGARFLISQPAPGEQLTLLYSWTKQPAQLQLVTSTGQTVSPAAVLSGAAVDDSQPPVTTVAVARNAEGVLQVTLSATDPGGSGVASIQYQFVYEQQPHTYTGPFPALPGTKITVWATDNALNAETPHSRLIPSP